MPHSTPTRHTRQIETLRTQFAQADGLPFAEVFPAERIENALREEKATCADDVPARAQKIVKEHASDAISSVFARKSGGGLGIGNAAKTESQNSIERLVREWSAGRATDRDSMEKHHADYVKVTKVIAAMAELAPYRMPDYVARQQRDHAEWMRVAREFKTGAAELGKAVQMKDPARIKKSAGVLHHTCCDCHSLL